MLTQSRAPGCVLVSFFLPVLSLETSVCMLSIINCLFYFGYLFIKRLKFSNFFDIRVSLEIQKF